MLYLPGTELARCASLGTNKEPSQRIVGATTAGMVTWNWWMGSFHVAETWWLWWCREGPHKIDRKALLISLMVSWSPRQKVSDPS